MKNKKRNKNEVNMDLKKLKQNKNEQGQETSVFAVCKIGGSWRIQLVWEAERRERRKYANRRRNQRRKFQRRKKDSARRQKLTQTDGYTRSLMSSRRWRNIQSWIRRRMEKRQGRWEKTQETVDDREMQEKRPDTGPTSKALSLDTVLTVVPSLREEVDPILLASSCNKRHDVSTCKKLR